MELRQLKYFISVAEHLNFTEASKQLFVGQPAISKQIASLEQEIGFKLFIRDKHSVQLTQAGTVFLNEVIEIFNKLESAVHKGQEASKGTVGVITIGFLPYHSREFLSSLLKKFQERFPNIHLNLKPDQQRQTNEDLLNDKLDIAFTISLGLENIAGLQLKTLFTHPYCVVMNDEHPLSKKDNINISDLSEENFIMLEKKEAPIIFDFVLNLCEKHGFSPKITSQNPRIETVLMLIESGMGITILPKYLLVYASPTLLFKDIKGADKVEVVAAWKKANRNPSNQLFIDEINNYFS